MSEVPTVPVMLTVSLPPPPPPPDDEPVTVKALTVALMFWTVLAVQFVPL